MVSMSTTQENVQTVKVFFEALGRGDRQGLQALAAPDIEWSIPGKDWPLAGTYHGHAGMADALQKASVTLETSYPEPPQYVAEGDRVVAIGVAIGKVKATNKEFEDKWVFDITVRDGKVSRIQEYIDTQALARAAAESA
jgi:ketosteroid isomerase-like protein